MEYFFANFPEIKCFFKDAASMEDFVRSCDRTMMPVSIKTVIIIIIMVQTQESNSSNLKTYFKSHIVPRQKYTEKARAR